MAGAAPPVRVSFVLVLLLGGLQDVVAQHPRLRFEHLTLEDGLSHTTVESVVQGPDGFLWFGTQDGLNRYDGYDVKIYHHVAGDSTSLSGDAIWTLFVDQDDRLWVGTENGLDRYDPATDQFIRYPLGGPTENRYPVYDIDEDSQGRLWIATLGAGVYRMDPATRAVARYRHRPGDPKSLSSSDVWALEVDGRGDVWIGTARNGLDRLDPDTGLITRVSKTEEDAAALCSSVIRSILEDRMGRLWVGMRGGISRFDSSRTEVSSYCSTSAQRTLPSLSSPNVVEFYEDRDGRLWVATDGGGLNLYVPSRGEFVHYQSTPGNGHSLRTNVVYSVVQDRCGDLWVGNFNGGVNHFNANNTAVRLYQHRAGDPASLSHNAVLAFHEGKRGNVWIGTDGGGLNRFDPTEETFTRYVHEPDDANSLGGNKVVSVIQDRNDVVWAGTHFNGLNRFNPQTGQFKHFVADPSDSTSLGTNSVWALHEDQEGRLWVGAYGSGLDLLNRETGTFRHFHHRDGDPTSLVHNRVLFLHEDAKGRLWVGTEGGLSRMIEKPDGSISFKNFARETGPPNGLTENWVLSIHETDEGLFWIGTKGGGLNRLNPETGTFQAYRTSDGLLNDVVYGILEDEQGDLWLSTNQGLSEFDPDTETFTNYDANPRLQPGVFNRPDAYLKHSSGALYFGGTKGFNVFHPDSIKQNECIPPVHITKVNVMNEPASIGGPDAPLQRHPLVAGELQLDPGEDIVSFEYAALNYRMSEKNRYEYRLEGFDDEWQAAGSRRYVSYTNLDPGTYTFRVRGSNNSGLWNSDGASLTVRVLPPFWQTWWFYGLITLLAATVLVAVHRYRLSHIRHHKALLEQHIEERRAYEKSLIRAKKKAEEMNELKSAFLTNMSHEIRTPLTAIIGFAETLTEQFKPEFAERIIESGHRLMRTLDSVLELSQLQSGSYELQLEPTNVVAAVRDPVERLRPRAEEKGLSLVLDTTTDHIEAQVDTRLLNRILTSLLDNAIKFTSDGEVRVEVCATDDTLRLTVQDTGKGIEASFLPDVFQMFTQESSGLDRSHEGTGLGLHITKRLVTVLGGEIEIDSEKNVGTTVTVQLPRYQEEPFQEVPTTP